ncbi:response regulator, partial [Acinetobacter baumannii]
MAHLQAQAVDLVLLDIHLPDGHGLSDLPLLRALAPQARVLLMSSDIEPAQVAQARADGVDGFVPKSAQAAEIVAAVQAIL